VAIAEGAGADIKYFSLADTMGWATPLRIERVLDEVRSRWPDVPISLHLHDTRGLAVANAHAGLKMGVTQFDSTVGGLGGCRSPANRKCPATSAPRSWCCSARRWASIPVSTSTR
jgi:isopropylmalate/homocitrate/citramalate synthase